MAEWRAELQNYHIKPGFPRTLGGTSVVATDSEKKASIMKIKVRLLTMTTTASLEIIGFVRGYVRGARPIHLPRYTCPHTGPDIN